LLDERSSLYANELNLWFFGFGVVVLSFFFAIPFTLLFEAPFLNIEKYLLLPAPKKEIKTKAKENYAINENSEDFVKYRPLYEEEQTEKRTQKLLE
jgi:hypothetical protein